MARAPKKILFPLPDTDFDVTESAVPWKLLSEAGHTVEFATEHGATPSADPLLLSGVVFGKLGARAEAIEFYRAMEQSPAFRQPHAWTSLDITEFDAVFLAGGHAAGMRQYLGSEQLHQLLATFWRLERPVAAICHGVLALARAIDPDTGVSVLHDRKTTCLPKYMERTAYWLTAWRRGRYYRTYRQYVQDEVSAALADAKHQFVRGPRTLTARGTADNDEPAFIVRDRNYVSARWPGDSYLIAKELLRMVGSEAVLAA